MSSLRILDCEIEDAAGERRRADVLVQGPRIARVCAAGELPAPAESDLTIPANGGALLPALHDHHIHLFALAAARASVDCGSSRVATREDLGRALEAAPDVEGSPVRAVGYHESLAGDLARNELDAIAPTRGVRIQHRTGALWMLNSRALEAAGLAGSAPDGGWPDGAELDRHGRSNGRFFRLDDWLAERFERSAATAPGAPRRAPDLSSVSRELAARGVASVTDATPRNDAQTARSFALAQQTGALLQRVRMMGAAGPRPELATAHGDAAAQLSWGEHKIVLDDRSLPSLDDVAERIARAHADDRGVAIHCVTRSELVLAAGALEAAGVHARDRIEHASVTPPDALDWLAQLGICVVTQPGFIAERGDDYLRDVDPRDQPWLYRCAAFDRAGVPVGAGSDAPYGDADPWLAMRAAVDRTTPAGRVLGADDRVSPERALALFTSPAEAPGAAPRLIAEGELADLVLLDCNWARAREHLDCTHVAATLAAGRVIESRFD